MDFSQNDQFTILACQRCEASGQGTYGKCAVCQGAGRITFWNNELLFWNWPVSRFQLSLRRGRNILNAFRMIGALLFAFGLIGLFLFNIVQLNIVDDLFTLEFWVKAHVFGKSLFWLGIVALGYVWYRVIVMSKPPVLLPHYERIEYDPASTPALDWDRLRKEHKIKRRDLGAMFTGQSKLIIDTAFRLALAEKAPAVTLKHLLLAMLDKPMVSNMLIRLNVSPQTIKAKISKFPSETGSTAEPVMSPEVEQIIFNAYAIAAKTQDSHVRESELLLAIVRGWPELQELLYDVNIDSTKLDNVVAWVRIREKLRENYLSLRKASSHRDKHGMDRAMTAVSTPFLNQFSEDITLKAQFGHLEPCVARETELEEIFRIIEGGQQSVLLVGPVGVGKMSIIEGIAQRMIEDDVPDRLKDKRLVQISTSALLAGTTVSGAQERLIHIMNELSKARNIILVINNVTDLITGGKEDSGMNVAETLAEYLSGGNFLTIATTNPDAYHRHIANTELSSVFAKVEVPIMEDNQVIQVLESKVGYVEYKHQVFFSYDALSACVTYALRFLHDQYVPESALALMSESASLAHAKHAKNPLVTGEDVAQVIGQKTGIPSTTISEDESSKLLRLEEAMHERVVGQSEAVTMVASALRRARAEIRSKNRPIANFLFLGPTGVGKTELAKTIADVYFGNEDRMIRVDMSEYQDKTSMYRLIGQPGEQGSGLLTEAVREKPFSLVLLDELEKADPNILNLFLSVFDDGRLTDSVGRVIDFTNTIIIATSNAGTGYIQEAVQAGKATGEIREQLLRKELKQFYRPEFLNRFDGVIVFTPLTREEIKQVAKFMLKRVAKDLEKRGVALRIEDAALEALAEVGFDPEFGARPMRRAIQERVEDKLAELVLNNKLTRRSVVVLGEGANITVENPTR